MAKPPLHCIDDVAQARFWEKLPFRADGQCWEWQGTIVKKKYGVFSVGGSSFRAHRVALYLETGVMPEGLYALHGCDNPPCCNPAHLRWGTHRDNQQDKVERGRVRGAKNSRAKISEMDAVFIRATDRPTSQLVEWFGLSKASIDRIRRGACWAVAP